MKTNLDAIDKKILQVLQNHGDITNQALADKIGLSPPPCLKRVRRLKKAGIITKTVALLDPEKIGQSIVAFVDVELEKQTTNLLNDFENMVLEHPEIMQCYMVSGKSDYLLVINVADMASYDSFVREVLANETNMYKYKTRFCMHRTKYNTAFKL